MGDVSLFDNEFYRSLIESMEEGVFVVDTAERIVEVNPGAARILGSPEEELRGRSLNEAPRITCEDGTVLAKDDHPAVVTLRTGMSLSNVVLEVARPDGSTVWVSVNSRPLRRAGEMPHGVLCTFRDITHDKEMERALRESESKLRTFILEIPVGALMVNAQGLCTFVNRTWSELSGMTEDECYGEGWMRAVHPDDHRNVLVARRRLLDLGLNSAFEFRFLRPDSTVAWVSVKSVAIREEKGVVLGQLWAATDITDRKHAEEERDRLFTVSLDLLCVARVDGYFQRVNPAFTRVFGFSTNELLSRPIIDLLHPEDRIDMQEQFAKLVSGYDGVKFEGRCQCKDGSYRWISWHFPAPVDGLLYVVARDVTERKRTEAALLKAAHTDQLTGLQNRTTLMSSLAGKIARAERYDSKLAVLFIDLDGFKEVNDTYGHDAGDFVLREVASRLRTCVRRRNDIVARLGGDEYVIVLDDLGQETDAHAVATKILSHLSEAIYLPTKEDVVVRASIGISTYPTDGGDAETLVREADKGMYVSKGKGGHRFS